MQKLRHRKPGSPWSLCPVRQLQIKKQCLNDCRINHKLYSIHEPASFAACRMHASEQNKKDRQESSLSVSAFFLYSHNIHDLCRLSAFSACICPAGILNSSALSGFKRKDICSPALKHPAGQCSCRRGERRESPCLVSFSISTETRSSTGSRILPTPHLTAV